jgi:hypothetical protein
MSKISTKSKVIVAGVAGLSLGISGVAYAYWSTSGVGNGTATTSAGAANLDVQQTASPSDLAPGVASEAVTGTVQNNAANNAHTTQIIVTVASVAPVACATDNYGLVAGSAHAILTSGVQSVTLPFVHDMTPGQLLSMPAFDLGFINKAVLQDECKSAVPTLHYAVS